MSNEVEHLLKTYRSIEAIIGKKKDLEERMKDFVGPVNGGDRHPTVTIKVEECIDLLEGIELEIDRIQNPDREVNEKHFANQSEYLAYIRNKGRA